jgi:hypothetical protein
LFIDLLAFFAVFCRRIDVVVVGRAGPGIHPMPGFCRFRYSEKSRCDEDGLKKSTHETSLFMTFNDRERWHFQRLKFRQFSQRVQVVVLRFRDAVAVLDGPQRLDCVSRPPGKRLTTVCRTRPPLGRCSTVASGEAKCFEARALPPSARGSSVRASRVPMDPRRKQRHPPFPVRRASIRVAQVSWVLGGWARAPGLFVGLQCFGNFCGSRGSRLL